MIQDFNIEYTEQQLLLWIHRRVNSTGGTVTMFNVCVCSRPCCGYHLNVFSCNDRSQGAYIYTCLPSLMDNCVTDLTNEEGGGVWKSFQMAIIYFSQNNSLLILTNVSIIKLQIADIKVDQIHKIMLKVLYACSLRFHDEIVAVKVLI